MPPPASKKRAYEQTFCDSWLENPIYAPWLEKCEDPLRAKCKFCKKTMTARKSTLDMHNTTSVHILNMRSMQQKGKRSEDEGAALAANFQTQVKLAESRFALDVVDHNRSFYSFEHFVEMCNIAAPNIPIFENMTFKRTKITRIVKNVINKHIMLQIKNDMQNKFYSVLMDESTDVANIQHACILARYVDGSNIKTVLLDLIRVDIANSENLFLCLKHTLDKYNLSLNNLVGFCADNANVMVGTNNSVSSRLLAANSEISIFPCICHSFHLVAMHAYQALPEEFDTFLHSLYSYFSRSPKRQTALEYKQIEIKMPIQKILEPSKTRWLALHACIQRILYQWPVLFEVFKDATNQNESKSAANIFNGLNCKCTKAYLQFLTLPVELISEYNLIFQSSHFNIHTVLPKCRQLLQHIAKFFIKSTYANSTNLHQINIDEEEILLPLESIYIGKDAICTIQELRSTNLSENNEKIKIFYEHIQQFYKIMLREICNRMPFNETFLDDLSFLYPENALSINHNFDSLSHIIDKFPNKFNKSQIQWEWHILPTIVQKEKFELMRVMCITDFWDSVSNIKNSEGTELFPNIVRVAQLCLSMPHSNADVERVFSLVTNIKTKHRNRLKSETVAALARIKLDFKNKKQDCRTYQISKEMLELFNKKMYDRERVPESLEGILLPEMDAPTGSETSECENM